MSKYIAKPVENGEVGFSQVEQATWRTLIARQQQTIQGRCCDEFLVGLEAMNFAEGKVPNLNDVSDVLSQTGWQVEPVYGTIYVEAFFKMLSNRRFPVATFIRTPEDLDYLQQPDIFHELFGHCPMLTLPAYADFMQWYGEFASTLSKQQQKILSRLFWFTIEFGLLKHNDQYKVYGGGILSSHQETIYAVESDMPERKMLDIETVLATEYFYDRIQTEYFCLESMDDLLKLADGKVLTEALKRHENDSQKEFEIS